MSSRFVSRMLAGNNLRNGSIVEPPVYQRLTNLNGTKTTNVILSREHKRGIFFLHGSRTTC